MWKLALLIALAPWFARANTDWFCSEESSERRGNSLYVCGVGQSEDEAQARAQALVNARMEFASLCAASDDCRGHRITVSPGRTVCEGTKCTRLLVYTIESHSGTSARLQTGMSREDVLSQFGMPEKTGHPSDGTLCYRYKGAMCEGEYCFVYFRDGQVTKTYDFNSLYVVY